MIDHECNSCGSIFSIEFEFSDDSLSFCPSCGVTIEEELDNEDNEFNDDDDEWGT